MNTGLVDLRGYVAMRRAQAITGGGAARVYRLAMLNQIRFVLAPGERPLYCEEDLRRIADQSKAK